MGGKGVSTAYIANLSSRVLQSTVCGIGDMYAITRGEYCVDSAQRVVTYHLPKDSNTVVLLLRLHWRGNCRWRW